MQHIKPTAHVQFLKGQWGEIKVMPCHPPDAIPMKHCLFKMWLKADSFFRLCLPGPLSSVTSRYMSCSGVSVASVAMVTARRGCDGRRRKQAWECRPLKCMCVCVGGEAKGKCELYMEGKEE